MAACAWRLLALVRQMDESQAGRQAPTTNAPAPLLSLQLLCSYPPGKYTPAAVYVFSVLHKVPVYNGRPQGRAPLPGYTTAEVAQLPPFQAPSTPVPRCVPGGSGWVGGGGNAGGCCACQLVMQPGKSMPSCRLVTAPNAALVASAAADI